MRQFVRIVFTSLRPAYLLRQYIFSGLFTLFFYFLSPSYAPISFYVFLGISFLLYPFAMFVYDSLIGLLMGDRIWLTSGLFAILWGSFKGLLIYFLSVLLAPIGILLLYFTNR
uniref:hypothetical protein n=1 Tax=Candidatus Enterococcus willemsii TaxID=1857215 RepID=UPI00403F7D11